MEEKRKRVSRADIIIARIQIDTMINNAKRMKEKEIESQVAEAKVRSKFFKEKMNLGWESNRIFNEWNKLQAEKVIKR